MKTGALSFTLAVSRRRGPTPRLSRCEPGCRDPARGPVADVVEVAFHALAVGQVVAARHLPHPGEARGDLLLQREILAVHCNFITHDGAWAHHAHLAEQDVPDLWKLIQAGLAKNTATGVT